MSRASKVFTVPNNVSVNEAERATYKFWILILSTVFVAAAATAIVQVYFAFGSQGAQDTELGIITFRLANVSQRVDALQLASNNSAVNMLNMEKIANLTSTTATNFTEIYNEIAIINTLLNVTSNSPVINVTQVNTEIEALQAKDMTLMLNVSDLKSTTQMLTGQVTANELDTRSRIASMNGVNGTNPAGALTLNALPGMSVTPSAMPNTLDIGTSAVLTLQAQSPSGAGDINLVGQCGFNVTAGPMANEVTLDTCALATTINNLDMQLYMQGMQIGALNATDMDLQMQIDALSTAGETIQVMLNETETEFNMTLVQLINQVMLLQTQVTNLQNTINNANSSSVPPGTMMPYGGLTAPLGYLVCDGSTLSASTYPALEMAIGQSFCGGGCAAGFFRIPDLRGKVPVAENGATFTSRGTEVGEESVALAETHLPAHRHTIDAGGGHEHDVVLGHHTRKQPLTVSSPIGPITSVIDIVYGGVVQGNGVTGNNLAMLSEANVDINQPCNGQFSYSRFPKETAGTSGCTAGNGAIFDGTHTHGGGFTGNTGTGTAHQNIQPSVTIGTYIIKT